MITSFDGENRFLSNFYPSRLIYAGGILIFPTVEHAYQAAKTDDKAEWLTIAHLATPGLAKKYGQKVTLKANWDQVKLETMEELLQDKFAIPQLKQQLINTGTQELVEGNYWGDTYWGVCRGKGQNNLGKLLMKIRSSIQ